MGKPKSLKWIQKQSSDNSASTKLITYAGEVEDFVQFTAMTGFSDGIDAVAHHGLGKENYIPNYGLGLLDVFSYGVMWHLAGMREGKFYDRRALLSDNNSAAYYHNIAVALYDALDNEEKEALDLQRRVLITNPAKANILASDHDAITKVAQNPFWNNDDIDNISLIIHLLKNNARLIRSSNLPAARTTITTWNAIFEKAKKRPAFSNRYYVKSYQEAFTSERFAEPVKGQFEYGETSQKTAKDIERKFVYSVLNKYKSPKVIITKADAENFIAKVSYLELIHSDEDIRAHHKELLSTYGVPVKDHGAALSYLDRFYETYHGLQDSNDMAFYKANLRGIQKEEDYRTKFKSNLFRFVKNCSAIATGYSVGVLITSVVYEITKHDPLPMSHMVAPLFLVGATSLVDETSDLYFKWKKYDQSKTDLKQWESENHQAKQLFPFLGMQNLKDREKYSKEELARLKGIYEAHQQTNHIEGTLTEDLKLAKSLFAPHHPVLLNADQITALNTFYNTRQNEIYRFYLGARKEDEKFDPKKFNLMYLRAKYAEHKELSERLSRRETKLFQACCSFTGVFFGVLISWAIALVTIVHDMPEIVTKLSFLGLTTIAMAGVAGGVMVKYQMGQNAKKVEQGQESLEKAKKGLFFACPNLMNHAPREVVPEIQPNRLTASII